MKLASNKLKAVSLQSRATILHGIQIISVSYKLVKANCQIDVKDLGEEFTPFYLFFWHKKILLHFCNYLSMKVGIWFLKGSCEKNSDHMKDIKEITSVMHTENSLENSRQ